MAVREDDGAEPLRVELALGGVDEAAGAGVQQYLGAAEAEPDAPGRRQLPGDHEPGAGRTQEGDAVRGVVIIVHDGRVLPVSIIVDAPVIYNVN